MFRARRSLPFLLAWGLLLSPGSPGPGAQPAAQQPRESGLIEKTGRRLAQLDVTFTGPEDALRTLSRDDLELVVGGEFIDSFTLDRTCPSLGESAPLVEPAEPEAPAGDEPAPVAAPSASFLFYFDQYHLTQAGRNRGLNLALELIPELVVDGNRAMVVSNARKLETFATLTDDVERLLDAVERVRSDPQQWDPFAIQEESRLEEVLDALDRGDTTQASIIARRHQQEERWRHARSLNRFSMVLGRMADLPPPKIVVYFADTMRQNAGEHYGRLFNANTRNNLFEEHMEIDSFTAGTPFDRVLREAASHGIRLYAVEAQGLKHDIVGIGRSAAPATRIADAQDSLKGFALETGGRAFINGAGAKKIVRALREDLSCVALISFDPAGLPEDVSLPVRLRIQRDKVRAHVRGRIVVQSESARLTSRLLGAFGASSVGGDDAASSGTVIPTGYEDGRFSALVQFRFPASPVSGAVWDLGASVVTGSRIPLEASGRVSISGPGVPVVLEAEVSFRPGPYSVVAVAHEQITDQVRSKEIRGEWPNPNAERALIMPPAILQPASAAFLRGEESKKSGALAVADGGWVDPGRPTAFVGVVCWDRVQKKPLRVERRLVGDSSADFPPMEVQPETSRCASFRDLVGPGTMTSGSFTYEVRVFVESELVASADRVFAAKGADLAEAADPAGAGTP